MDLERDGSGKLWITTNIDMGDFSDNDALGGVNHQSGCSGRASFRNALLRFGTNLEGDMFTVPQGTDALLPPLIICASEFTESYNSIAESGYGNRQSNKDIPDRKIPYPEALATIPELVPPAVWLPYNKVGRSAIDIQVIDQNGLGLSMDSC